MSSSAAPDVPPHGDPDKFRHVLSHVPTSVVVVTGVKDDGTRAGMVIGSFTSISLDPQLVGFYPTHASTSWPPIRDAGRFVVNVLAQGQDGIARQFSRRGGDKFEGVDVVPSPHSGAPILKEGIVAWIDCELDREIELGDHFLVVGRVVDLDVVPTDDHPMVFSRGAYPVLGD
ncbi:flavin reductase family protein [Patulibacter sp.]|uniref:flavin reductase family protein n=1 Tax=Patulibacter sp. TaxID=1912859 RepID=UPI0027246A06|nr:flavin reductase family protein [Patulibacter sp.]MDO9407853.1 flavin reductase family protein [Patulibacter sp.]